MLMFDTFQTDQFLVDPQVKIAVLIQYLGNASGHSRGKILAGRSKDDGNTASHIFTAMISHAFDHCRSAGIPDAEAFSGDAADKSLAAGRAV